jgi:hypothetical protein
MSLATLALLLLPSRCPVVQSSPLDHLLAGSWRFLVHRVAGNFQDYNYSGLSVIQSMATDGRRIYVGDELGGLDVIAPRTHQVVRFLQLDRPIRALAATQAALFVGFSDGEVQRLDSHSGLPLESRTVPTGVSALLTDGGSLFAAGTDGAIYRAPVAPGAFQTFAQPSAVGLKALGLIDGDLFALDASGWVVTLDSTTGAVSNAYSVGAIEGMIVLDRKLLFSFVDDEGDWEVVLAAPETGLFLGQSVAIGLPGDNPMALLELPRQTQFALTRRGL